MTITLTPKAIGERTEALCLARLIIAGYAVLQPFGDNQRYDLVVEEDGVFTRIQCKTGQLLDGAVQFATSSVDWYTHERQAYTGQADVFMVYCPDNETFYWVPIDDVPDSHARLRVDPAKNGQVKGIRWASNYIMEKLHETSRYRSVD